jgi:hypothetical protein
MTMEFTKRGHRLEQDEANPMIFRCRSRAVWLPKDTLRRTDDHLLAALLIYAPATAGQMIATLRAWLSVYEDDELLEQAEAQVRKTFEGISPLPPSTPSTAPPGQNQGFN